MDTSTRLRGHGLLSEGKPYEFRPDAAEQEIEPWQRRWRESAGHGVCSCGASSSVLESDGARKRWHKAHKDEIRNGATR